MTDAPNELEKVVRHDGLLADFLSPASFRPPERIVRSGWHEHAPFAFWLVEQQRPKILVELGTHCGFSFFAFCQAIRMAQLSAAAFAVDHWTGDEHAGFYGEDVYEGVQSHCRERYSDIATLMRMEFSDALQYFDDGSVDLLHVDGRHHLDDVVSDFTPWLPKLSHRAVVLFHDTNVRDRKFGVHRFWSELCNKYPSFSFIHGHGLGVLGVGKAVPAAIVKLFEASTDDTLTASIRNAYARLGGAVVKNASEELILRRDQLAAELETARAAIAERERAAAALVAELEAARAAVHGRETALADGERKVAALGEELAAAKSASEELHRECHAAVAREQAQQQAAAALAADLEVARFATSERDSKVVELAGQLGAIQSLSEQHRVEHDQLAAALEEEKAKTVQVGERAASSAKEAEELRSVIGEYERTATDLLADLEKFKSLADAREAAVAESERKLSELAEQLTATRNAFEALGQERDRLAAAVEEEKAALAHNRVHAASLLQEAEALRAVVWEHETVAARLNAALHKARSEASAQTAELDRLGGELRSSEAIIRDRDDEIGRLSHDVEVVRDYLRDSQTDVQRLAGELDAAQGEIERTNAERQRLSEAVADRSHELDVAHSRVVQLQHERDELHLTASQLPAMRSQVIALREALADARQQGDRRDRRISGLSIELKSHATAREHIHRQLRASEQAYERAEREWNDLAAAHAVEIRGLETRLADLSAEKQGLTEELARAADEIRRVEREAADRATAERIAGKARRNNVSSTNSGTRWVRSAVSNRTPRTEFAVLEKRLAAESGEKERLTADLARAAEEIYRIEGSAADRIAAAEARHATAVAESETKAQAEIRRLRDQLVDAEAAVARMRVVHGASGWQRLLSRLERRRIARLLIRTGATRRKMVRARISGSHRQRPRPGRALPGGRLSARLASEPAV